MAFCRRALPLAFCAEPTGQGAQRKALLSCRIRFRSGGIRPRVAIDRSLGLRNGTTQRGERLRARVKPKRAAD